MKTGKLTGVGVGPGDPEHITLKALKAIKTADILMLPAKSREACRAYMIAEEACEIFNREIASLKGTGSYFKTNSTSETVSDNTSNADPDNISDDISGRDTDGKATEHIVNNNSNKNQFIDISDKDCIFEPFPMKMDKQSLHNFHTNVANKISSLIADGKNVVFLAIGDPCIYSTFHYIASIIKDEGYETEWINGIPSFCASAARLGISLAQNNEPIHIIPGKCDLNDIKELKGTRVIMKPSRTDPAFRDYIKEAGSRDGCSVYWVSECGLPGERIAYKASEIPEDMGYMSVVIIRE